MKKYDEYDLHKKIDKLIESPTDDYIEVNLSHLNEDEFESFISKLYYDLMCISDDFLYIYLLLEGNPIRKCSHCDKWQRSETKNEFEEYFDITGSYPDHGSGCLPSDSYYYCTYCFEYNFVDNEELSEQITDDELKYINYKLTRKIYIFHDSSDKSFDLDQDNLYSSSRTYEKRGPDHLLGFSEILIDCTSLILYENFTDTIKDIENNDETELSLWKYLIYMPYSIYVKKYNIY
jgi:hypothetical protein